MPPQIWAIRADDGSNRRDWWGYRKPSRSTYSIYSLRSPWWREPILLRQVVEFVFWKPNIYTSKQLIPSFTYVFRFTTTDVNLTRKPKRNWWYWKDPTFLLLCWNVFRWESSASLSLMVSFFLLGLFRRIISSSCSLITLGSWANPSIFPSFLILAHIWVNQITWIIIPCIVSTQWWSI